MKKFFRDYKEWCDNAAVLRKTFRKENRRLCKVWCTEHWRGFVFINVFITVVGLLFIFRNDIKELITYKCKDNIIEVES